MRSGSNTIIKGISNFTNTQNINYYEFFDESKEKLSNNLQNKIPINYTYIYYKASLLLSQGFSEYRENDLFNYPLTD